MDRERTEGAVVANEKPAEYEIVPFPRMRHLIIDVMRAAHRRHMIHGLIEVDVTRSRQYIREQEASTGEQLSFTAFVATCLCKAVDMNKYLHAVRNWRGQLVLFDEVDVNTMIDAHTKMANVQIRRVPHNRYQVPDWVHEQVHLNPYPNELMLQNHVQVQELSTANCRDSHGCAPLQNDRDQLIFELPTHRSRVRTLTTSQVQLLRDNPVSTSLTIGTTPRWGTCLKSQTRV